ncbi:MAG: putative toxin-antitoxin system toxin component, PIN family [Deltaproteobacteria bacterium]|nr:putative toxin-antitoxin system toxin component, PIN family [Deltaproteobacteria bacterium]
MTSEIKRPRVVLDTNVYVAGITFPGLSREVLELMLKEKIEVYISQFIIEEIRRVLKDKFGWADKPLNRFLELIRRKAITVHPTITISLITQKTDDNRILECAVAAKAQYLVTGDKKHLLPLKEYEGIKILSPSEFLETI